MGRVVRAEAQELLDRPALAVAQQVRRDAEHHVDLRRALLVAMEDDVRAQRLGRLRRRSATIGAERSTMLGMANRTPRRARPPRSTYGVTGVPPTFIATYLVSRYS